MWLKGHWDMTLRIRAYALWTLPALPRNEKMWSSSPMLPPPWASCWHSFNTCLVPWLTMYQNKSFFSYIKSCLVQITVVTKVNNVCPCPKVNSPPTPLENNPTLWRKTRHIVAEDEHLGIRQSACLSPNLYILWKQLQSPGKSSLSPMGEGKEPQCGEQEGGMWADPSTSLWDQNELTHGGSFPLKICPIHNEGDESLCFLAF